MGRLGLDIVRSRLGLVETAGNASEEEETGGDNKDEDMEGKAA